MENFRDPKKEKMMENFGERERQKMIILIFESRKLHNFYKT